MSSTVKDVMTTRVVAVRKNASYKEIAARLREYRVSAFPVLDEENKVIGIVSEGDMLTKEALEGAAPGFFEGILRRKELAKADAVTAADLMTQPAITVRADESVAHAARVMYGRRLRRLPVVTSDGHLVGIVSRADLLSVYSRPDAEITHEITGKVILDTLLTDPALFTVTVKDGIVTIEGTPETSSLGRDIIDSSRHVEGVVAVRDRLDYPDDRQAASMGPRR